MSGQKEALVVFTSHKESICCFNTSIQFCLQGACSVSISQWKFAGDYTNQFTWAAMRDQTTHLSNPVSCWQQWLTPNAWKRSGIIARQHSQLHRALHVELHMLLTITLFSLSKSLPTVFNSVATLAVALDWYSSKIYLLPNLQKQEIVLWKILLIPYSYLTNPFSSWKHFTIASSLKHTHNVNPFHLTKQREKQFTVSMNKLISPPQISEMHGVCKNTETIGSNLGSQSNTP